jgi:hypothetical protein
MTILCQRAQAVLRAAGSVGDQRPGGVDSAGHESA